MPPCPTLAQALVRSRFPPGSCPRVATQSQTGIARKAHKYKSLCNLRFYCNLEAAVFTHRATPRSNCSPHSRLGLSHFGTLAPSLGLLALAPFCLMLSLG